MLTRLNPISILTIPVRSTTLMRQSVNSQDHHSYRLKLALDFCKLLAGGSAICPPVHTESRARAAGRRPDARV